MKFTLLTILGVLSLTPGGLTNVFLTPVIAQEVDGTPLLEEYTTYSFIELNNPYYGDAAAASYVDVPSAYSN